MNWFHFQREKTKLAKTKTWLKRALLGAVAISALALSSFAPVLNDKAPIAKATGTPRFNFMDGDKDMIRGAKVGGESWSDPVSANLGDRIAVLVYYHNGMEDTVAHNVKVKVNLPNTFSNQIVLSGSIASDETSPIYDTIVNGQVVGKSGLTINLPSGLTGKPVYIPGTTKVYYNGSSTGTPASDGVVAGSGLNIGDIQGCWQYAGFVSFMFQINGESDLKIEKRVAHIGDASWATQIEAMPGEQVIYRVGIQNDGGSTAENVVLADDLPSNLIYTSGSAYLYTKEHPEGIKQVDTIKTGLALPNIVAGSDGAVYITYKAKLNSDMPRDVCDNALVNTAKILVGGVIKGFAQAKVIVKCAPLEKSMTIDKKVKSGNSYVEQNTAKVGDILEYRIIVKNTGEDVLNQTYIRDIIPIYTNYIPGSTKINGQTASDQIITANGLSLGSIAAGQEVTVIFRVTVIGCPPVGGYTLLNTAYGRAEGITEIHDSATTIISITGPIAPVIN